MKLMSGDGEDYAIGITAVSIEISPSLDNTLILQAMR